MVTAVGICVGLTSAEVGRAPTPRVPPPPPRHVAMTIARVWPAVSSRSSRSIPRSPSDLVPRPPHSRSSVFSAAVLRTRALLRRAWFPPRARATANLLFYVDSFGRPSAVRSLVSTLGVPRVDHYSSLQCSSVPSSSPPSPPPAWPSCRPPVSPALSRVRRVCVYTHLATSPCWPPTIDHDERAHRPRALRPLTTHYSRATIRPSCCSLPSPALCPTDLAPPFTALRGISIPPLAPTPPSDRHDLLEPDVKHRIAHTDPRCAHLASPSYQASSPS